MIEEEEDVSALGDDALFFPAMLFVGVCGEPIGRVAELLAELMRRNNNATETIVSKRLRKEALIVRGRDP